GGHGKDRGRDLVRLVAAREDDRRRPGRLGDEDRRGEQERAPAHSISARTAAPESSAFGTKPRDPHAGIRSPYSFASRLETRTTSGASPFAQMRRATSKPSRSGSWMSSRTTSGWSSATLASASAPPAASPTTVKPSASSTARAVARKLGWS